MTEPDVLTILNTLAEEFEAVDQVDLARAYRRAATLVEGIDEPVRRRRRRTVAGATGSGAAPTSANGRRRPGRPRRAPAEG